MALMERKTAMPDDPGSSPKPHDAAADLHTPNVDAAKTNGSADPAGQDSSASSQGSGFAGHQNWLERLVQKLTGSSPQSTRDMLETALGEDAESSHEAAFTEQERAMILRTLRFGGLRVENVMVPRADVIAIDEDASLADLYNLFVSAGHSRIPVYRETFDDALGMAHVKDLMKYIGEAGQTALSEGDSLNLGGADLSQTIADAKIRRDVLFVPPSMPVLNLLLRMQTTHVHLAIVVDEYGGSDGIVSIEDLVEEIVGDIEDEHDAESEFAIAGSLKSGLTASARTPVEDLETRLDLKLLEPGEEEDIDTLGGLVFNLADRVPQRGELITHDAGVEFEILDADPRRIKMLRVHVRGGASPNEITQNSGQKAGPTITVP